MCEISNLNILLFILIDYLINNATVVHEKYYLEKILYLPPLRQLSAATLLACITLSAQAQITTGAMHEPRMFHQASVLQDGRVLITGGVNNPSAPMLASTEIYDPATGTFQQSAPMKAGTRDHAAITLKDGRVLVVGGMNDSGSASFAEFFDPAKGMWLATGEMNTYFSRAMARLLPDGRVMVVDHGESGGHHAEIYDPVTGTFSKSGNMVEQTRGHGLVVLADGRVLKVGGYSMNGYSRNAEIWNPATNMWDPTGQMFQGRQDIQPVLLPDGKVLVAGGRTMDQLSSTEIYDPATGTFSRGTEMPFPYAPESSTVLGNGNILFNGPTPLMLQYQPATGMWNFAGPKRNPTHDTTVTRLPNGDLLMAGGAVDYDATSYAAVFDQACGGAPLRLYNPSSVAPSSGGSVGFLVYGAPGCRFEVSDLPSWLTPEPTNAMRINERGDSDTTFWAPANTSGAERSAGIYVANFAATVTQGVSADCPWAPYVNPASINIGYQGGTGTANVIAAATCAWNISSMPSFVTATSATSGKGNGSFTYSVPANTASTSRSSNGLLTAQGQSSSFTFTQDGTPLCPSMPKLTFTSLSYPANGGTIGVTITAAPTCPWAISYLPTWVKLAAGSSSSGTGNGGFSMNADANTTGAARSDNGMVSGQGYSAAFNLTQDTSPCANLAASIASISAPANGTVGSFSVTASPSCGWSVNDMPSWVRILSTTYSNANGSGNGTVSYYVTANSGASRSGPIHLNGIGAVVTINVNQAAVPVNSCSTAIVNGSNVSGFLKSMGCAAGARGSSYYVDRYTFTGTAGKVATITMSSSSFDTYLYLRDQAGTIVKADDDGGGGTNSRINVTLPSSGTYTIEATSYGANATGAYSLSFIQ